MLHQSNPVNICREHDVAREYFHKVKENTAGFTHNVSDGSLFYCISCKSDNKNFNVDVELKKFHELYDKHKPAEKGWEKFDYRIDKAPG